MRVLSTKKLSPSQKNLLLNTGLGLVEYDAIKIEFIDFPVENTQNAIITSKNTARAIVQRQVNIKNCFCVGEKTAGYLRENDYNIQETANYGADLGRKIAKDYSGEDFTFFCGNRRREELPAILARNEIPFKEVEVYNTDLNFREFQQEFDAIMFFSPSAVQSYSAQNPLLNSTAFCIGKTTAAEAKKHTKNIITATKPSIENVIVQVVNYFKK